MDSITTNFSALVSFILHIDTHLQALASHYGVWLYVILFLIVFCETGLVVLPFLPGDSLLFAAGSVAALSGSALDPHVLFLLFLIAAILGDTLNYQLGHLAGPRVFQEGRTRFFNVDHLNKTREFFSRYGGKTIIIARFVPIIRTFAPFVAGIGTMAYGRFLLYNIVGALLWVGLFTYSGYFFGQLPIVRNNFSLLIVAIILFSMLPAVIEYIRHRSAR